MKIAKDTFTNVTNYDFEVSTGVTVDSFADLLSLGMATDITHNSPQKDFASLQCKNCTITVMNDYKYQSYTVNELKIHPGSLYDGDDFIAISGQLNQIEARGIKPCGLDTINGISHLSG